MPNTTTAEFANTIDSDETAYNEPSHLDLQCLPSTLFFNKMKFILEVFQNFANVILTSAFFALYGLKCYPIIDKHLLLSYQIFLTFKSKLTNMR